nr:hypothetical protein [Lachnospiraceae bacterium]
MANDNKNDGLFHWNFDLQETDSDFTDIDYSANAIDVSAEGQEIKPLIFVDGNYKSGQTAPEQAAKEQPEYKEVSPKKKSSLGQKAGALLHKKKKDDLDYYDDQERYSEPKEKRPIPWKPIIIGGAILLAALIGLIIILVSRDHRKKVWAKNEDPAIEELVNKYFKAKTDADADAMEKIVVPEETVNSLEMTLQAKAYESYNDIRIYTYPGLKKTETGLFVTYNSKFWNIDTQLPTIGWYYVKQDSEKNLRLMSLTDKDTPEYKYIVSTYDGSTVEKLSNEVTAANKKAVEDDPILKKYLAQLATNNYETYVPETTEAPTTKAPVVTEPTTTEYIPEGPIGYVYGVEGSVLRMRSSMTTEEDNVIAAFPEGYALEIIEELDGWVHVKDTLNKDGEGNPQSPSGKDGYVSADFFRAE